MKVLPCRRFRRSPWRWTSSKRNVAIALGPSAPCQVEALKAPDHLAVVALHATDMTGRRTVRRHSGRLNRRDQKAQVALVPSSRPEHLLWPALQRGRAFPSDQSHQLHPRLGTALQLCGRKSLEVPTNPRRISTWISFLSLKQGLVTYPFALQILDQNVPRTIFD